MQITEARLRANGWTYTKKYGYALYFKPISKAGNSPIVVNIEFVPDTKVFLQFFSELYVLPNIGTLEALAQLEWLLSDTYMASIATLPAFAQADARRVDRTLEERGCRDE